MTYMVNVPGRHEAHALADRCGDCGDVITPTVVLDREDRTREAGYDCAPGGFYCHGHNRDEGETSAA